MNKILTKDDVVGIFPPMASPFTTDEEVDVPALRAELQFSLSLEGVMYFSTNLAQ